MHLLVSLALSVVELVPIDVDDQVRSVPRGEDLDLGVGVHFLEQVSHIVGLGSAAS